jgi:hypothetical protein
MFASGFNIDNQNQYLMVMISVEAFCFLEYNAMYSVRSERAFRRKMSPPYLCSKSTPSKKPVRKLYFSACFLLRLFFGPEEIRDIFLQNVGFFINTAVGTSDST